MTVIRFLFPAIAIILVVATVVLVLRALSARARINRQAYGVAQIEVRRRMKIDLLWAVGALILGAMVLGVWGLLLTTAAAEPEAQPLVTATSFSPVVPSFTPTKTAVAPTAVPTNPPTSTAIPVPSATVTAGTATPTPALEITPTETVGVPTALVTSEVGIYLRAEPNTEGEQVEWVLDGTLLVLLPGRETGSEFEWQQVRTPDGNEGWVAVPFIRYNE